jgi:hypothetical protein
MLGTVLKKFAWLWEVELQFVGLFEWSYGHHLDEINMAFFLKCMYVQTSFLKYLLGVCYIDAMPIKVPTRGIN